MPATGRRAETEKTMTTSTSGRKRPVIAADANRLKTGEVFERSVSHVDIGFRLDNEAAGRARCGRKRTGTTVPMKTSVR